VLYSFCPQFGCPDGAWPQAGLVEMNGVLYGTTAYGGGSGCGLNGIPGCGTVFAFDPDTKAENVLYAFGGGTAYPGPMIGVKGTLYGTTDKRFIFSVDTATDAEKVLYSFDSNVRPSGVIDVKHVLYGTTMMGGGNGAGTVFALEKTR
jgi:outer membrane protein assembly factor BamB